MNSAIRLLDISANKYSEKVALQDQIEQYTFMQLRTISRKLSMKIIEKNVLNQPVLVYMKKSARCLISFFSVLYSGNFYVPIPINAPIARIEKIIQNLNPSVVVTDNSISNESIEIFEKYGIKKIIYESNEINNIKENDELIDSIVDKVCSIDPIYIMYTSGSTGNPKGVTIPHKGVIDYVKWTTNTFKIDENTILGNQAPFYFDNSIFDIYGFLISGAKMIIIPEELFMFPSKLPEFIKENDITTIFWVPTVIINVANSNALEGIDLPKLKNVLFCGEVMPNAQLNVWRKYLPNCTYGNLYGPTEISDVCTYYIVDRPFKDEEPLPIGKACENMRIIILNEDNNMAKTNEIGEICVIGTGVGLGYWNAPEITNKVFVQNPCNSNYFERIYRTGDLGYINNDNLIMYVGRNDMQIKLKGNRIELGEIEKAMQCLEYVKNGCVSFDSKNEMIVAIIESDEEVKLRKFNLELKKYIPNYMLPEKLIIMDKLPYNQNGKIDRVEIKKIVSGEV